VGPARARELYLLNPKLPAAEAERIGLVSRAFPQAELLPRVLEIAAELARVPRPLSDSRPPPPTSTPLTRGAVPPPQARGPPLALRRVKQNLLEADRPLSCADAMDGEAERHARGARLRGWPLRGRGPPALGALWPRYESCALSDAQARTAMHPDAQEAGAAFVQKRRPRFEGTPPQEAWRLSKL
jgi:hypothetical protein